MTPAETSMPGWPSAQRTTAAEDTAEPHCSTTCATRSGGTG